MDATSKARIKFLYATFAVIALLFIVKIGLIGRDPRIKEGYQRNAQLIEASTVGE